MPDPAPPGPPKRPRHPATPRARGVRIRLRWPKHRWHRLLLLTALGSAGVGFLLLAFFWASYARMIDARLGGEQQPVPRIFGRPFDFAPGRGLSPAQLVQRLNDVGYAERAQAVEPGEFSLAAASVTVVTRGSGDRPSQSVRVDFTTGNSPIIRRVLDVKTNRPIASVTLEPPLLTALAPGQKRRPVPLATIPEHVKEAVLAIEDRRFYDHPGVDAIRAVGALVTNLRGDRPYLVGGSTLTQQIVKNTFLTPEKTLRRKLQEQFMALVLDSRFTKDQILELYLNEVVLGQRGPFAIHGVAEASRIFFGKDVSNVTLAEAATLAGLIQSPSALSPFRHPDRARSRRNVVLTAMVDAGFLEKDEAARTAALPLRVAVRALEDAAPYFVDYVSKEVDAEYDGVLKRAGAVDVHTTLDLHMQRIAQEAVADGLVQIDKLLPARRRGQAQVALVAMDPRTGDILAMVGGRAYSETQYNRAVTTRRQPGSTFKPFVYLAAFEAAATEGIPLNPATVMVDEPTVFMDGEKEYVPANYKDEYGGPMTLRRGLALSRNIVSIKVAEATGYDRVAAIWRRIGVGTRAQPFPSIALGVFEASALEMATAYTVFPNGGALRQPRAITEITTPGRTTSVAPQAPRTIARPDTTYLVTNMMRSVLNEGTGAAVRSSFRLDAAGKTGTTNDLRDAWFVGFTPELLTVVWVGLDNNEPIGLGGSQAALPIWTTFMRRALSGRPSIPFDVPPGIVHAEIDPDTGGLATPACPRVFMEAFLVGGEPQDLCPDHGRGGLLRPFSRLGALFRRIIRAP